MIPSSHTSCGLATLLGFLTPPLTVVRTMKTGGRWTTAMCISAMKRAVSNAAVAAETERYRRYAEAKARIPMNLSPREYEAEVKRLARRYRV